MVEGRCLPWGGVRGGSEGSLVFVSRGGVVRRLVGRCFRYCRDFLSSIRIKESVDVLARQEESQQKNSMHTAFHLSLPFLSALIIVYCQKGT